MALKEIPVLPEEHSLYDWSDWQSSRNALVSGTPTRYFAKEAWNSIVDTLNDALIAAGLQWDNVYTTAQEAKITVAYGKLTAAKFNSVRHNIEWPAPLGWAWAEHENFRGYVGRENFNGRSTHGKNCDRVYPEYIIELVRKLNLLLEIMRDTAMIASAEAERIMSLNLDIDVLSRQSAPASTYNKSKVILDSEGRAGIGVPLNSTTLRPLLTTAETVARIAAPIQLYGMVVPVLSSVEGASRKCAPMEVEALLTQNMEEADVFAVPKNRLVPLESDFLTEMLSDADLEYQPGLPMYADVFVVRSSSAAAMDKTKPVVINGSAESRTVPMAEIGMAGERMEVSSEHRGSSKVSCEISCGWDRPVWVDGGLWIKQAHTIIQREDGSLEVT